MSVPDISVNGGSAPAALPEPEFAVLGARTVRHAAAPTLALDLEVSERTGRPVYMIALTIQLMIDPARRTYDDATRERLLELFGAPERWAVTTRSLVWTQLSVLVPAFTGTTTVTVPIACNYDLELAAAKYLHSLPDGEAPLALHFNGTIYYPADDGGLQMVLVPWNKSIDFRMPVSVWRETIEHYYPNTGWVALRSHTLEALQRAKLERGLATLDACVEALLDEGGAVTEAIEALVDSLLYEGYALYPYTPGATKNATPTPFGIVYPPVYAAECAGAFDHARLECLAEPASRSTLTATLRYLSATGERHEATERRVELGPIPLGERDTVGFDGGRLTLRSAPEPGGRVLVRCCVHNLREVAPGLSRGDALRHSILSAQLLVRISSGQFLSPLEAGGESVNTYPVLAGDANDTVLGTTIVLPDHPQLAPESRGGLFDSTEIEEALLLHVQVLSDDERAEIERADPAVREMVARAAAATPEDIMALHGRVTLRDPVTTEPPAEPEGLPDPTAGEPEATVRGVRFVQGGHVVIRPGPDADLHARLLEGRTATVERILVDVDGKVHLGVTIDDDPGQDLLRETGRYLYFFAPEVEVIET